jgi:hypothetical protein
VHPLVSAFAAAAIASGTPVLFGSISILIDPARKTLVSACPLELPPSDIWDSFYCMILLMALFVSSCYWQPIALDTPLSSSWSANITTFGQALQASLSRPDIPLPSFMRVIDRCWCDFSTPSIFEPFNISNWEYTSVMRVKENLEQQNRSEDVPQTEPELASNEIVSGTSDSVPLTATSAPSDVFRGGWLPKFSLYYHEPEASSSHDPPLPEPEILPADQPPIPDVEVPTPILTWDKNEKLPFFRRKYDLRPYGMDMVVDFGWSWQALE